MRCLSAALELNASVLMSSNLLAVERSTCYGTVAHKSSSFRNERRSHDRDDLWILSCVYICLNRVMSCQEPFLCLDSNVIARQARENFQYSKVRRLTAVQTNADECTAAQEVQVNLLDERGNVIQQFPGHVGQAFAYISCHIVELNTKWSAFNA